MNKVADQIEQDSEQENEATAIELVEATLEELADEITGKLCSDVSAINAPLMWEAEQQTEKARSLRAQHAQLTPRVQASGRIIDREIDELIAQGGDAEAKRQERAELETNLAAILAQAEACERRAAELRAECGQNYVLVYNMNFPQIRESCIAAELALVNKLLNPVWAGLLRFQGESGLLNGDKLVMFVPDAHRDLLTPEDRGQEKLPFQKLMSWFGFGGRR